MILTIIYNIFLFLTEESFFVSQFVNYKKKKMAKTKIILLSLLLLLLFSSFTGTFVMYN